MVPCVPSHASIREADVSGGKYPSPSRYTFMRSVDEMKRVIDGQVQTALQQYVAFSLEQDGWSRHHRKYIGVTAGGPGSKRFFLTCF
jgi:hypothetical protein